MLKRNPRRRAKSSTRSRVAVATDGLPFSAPDTVPTESPSSAASSGIVTRLDGDMVAVYAFAGNNPNSQNPHNMPSSGVSGCAVAQTRYALFETFHDDQSNTFSTPANRTNQLWPRPVTEQLPHR